LYVPVQQGDSGYFFLKKGKDGKYMLPTPTSGYDKTAKDSVVSTYRHSYHKAMVSVPDYELTYTEIWKGLHHQSFDKSKIEAYIKQQVGQPAAGFSSDEIKLFFRQHIALESAYMLGIPIGLDTLKKFNLKDNFHATVSMLEVLGNNKDAASKDYLLNFIQQKGVDPFCTTIAIQSMIRINDPIYNGALGKQVNRLSNEKGSFGGDIMDPRVCTELPSPKFMVENLIRK
jgi:hypothetical protein